MTRKLKTLGVVLIAVFALTAVAASAASAANYTASKYPTTGTATSAAGNDVFTFEGGTVECAAHYEGTLNEASSDLTVTSTNTNCKAFGFLEASVTGCKMTLTAPGLFSTTTHYSGACTIKAGTCHVTVYTQGPRSHFSVTNNVFLGISMKGTVSGLGYVVVTDGFLCPFNGTGAKTGGTFNQKEAVAFKATNGATIDVG